MKCQILFPGKNKKNISKCCLLKILRRMLRLNRAIILKLKYYVNILHEETLKSDIQIKGFDIVTIRLDIFIIIWFSRNF